MLTLTYKGSSSIPIEAEGLRPDLLASSTVPEIERSPVQHGNRQEALAEFFTVAGDPADERLRIQGDCSRVKWIGAGMTRGWMTIDGKAGMHLGAEMEGGEIVVHGDAGDWAGAEMRGGRLLIHGHAGHLAGAAYRGSRLGMRGGTILIHGNADNEVGSGMRRGLIAVAGNVGDFAGVSMIAGTLVVGGQPGVRAAAGMKRGTVVLLRPGPGFRPLPSFRYACTYRPAFLWLYFRRLKDWSFTGSLEAGQTAFQRFNGDLVALGKGELLVAYPGSHS